MTGLVPTVREDELLRTLRQPEFFGQYGNIQKISISNRKNQDGQQQSLGIYVTFEKKDDAQRCIQAVNGSRNGDRILKAQLGTTKYCSAWLRHEQCGNRNCMFLHELGDEEDSYTRQDLSSLNSMQTQRSGSTSTTAAGPSTRQTPRQQAPAQPYQASQPMVRSASKEDSESGEAPALPASANWARNPQRSRRGSHATSGAASSPAVSMSLPATNEATEEVVEITPQEEAPAELEAPAMETTETPELTELPDPQTYADAQLKAILKILSTCDFNIRPSSPDNTIPILFDPRGGDKRRVIREEEERRLNGEQDEQNESLEPLEPSEGEPESGSLALGGEPEDRDHVRETHAFDQRRAIAQPPISRTGTESLYPQAIAQAFTQGAPGLASIASRSMTPQQQPYIRPQGSFSDNLPPGINATQSTLFQGQAHTRQTSRYGFGADAQTSANALKLAANSRGLMGQQASNPTFHSQPGYYGSALPGGPPPGLKSTGTPPNLFGQNNEALQNLIRGRPGVGQAHDATKREYMFSTFPYQHQYPPSTSSTPAPATAGLMAALYSNGAHQDIGAKQKKKGKKHRHANTSSSGGSGLVDLADPSILQVRLQHHPQSNAGVGSGLFGGQASGGYNPNMLYNNTQSYRGW